MAGRGVTLAFGSMPTLHMPQKSIPPKEQPHRKPPMERSVPLMPTRVAYYNFEDLKKDAGRKLPEGWVILQQSQSVLAIGQIDENADVALKVMFRESLTPIITRKGNELVKQFDVETNGLMWLIRELEKSSWCPGSTPRAKQCLLLVDDTKLCKFCKTVEERDAERVLRPVSLNTPLVTATKSALIQEVRNVRQQLKRSDGDLEYIKRKLQNESVDMSQEVQEGLKEVLESANFNDKPFLKLFWEEQKKAGAVDPRGMRWHPMMIRFSIFLHYQSPRAYEALRNTGVLHLPNKSTLRDYTNFFQPKEGFQPHVFEELKQQAQNFPQEKRYVVLLHDEMAVRGDLVYDHRGGQVVGFINPDAWTFNQNCQRALASHVLVFMIVGINNNIKQSLGYWASLSMTSDMLFPLLWEAVAYVEQQGLKVISSTSDKASPNQRLYRLHGDGIVHQTVNLYNNEDRPLYFISDPPHLIKTIRNNIERSGPGGTRYLWNNNEHLEWRQIRDVYEADVTNNLRLTKLRDEHVRLTPSSRMSVRLAAQVLSNSVGIVLRDYHQANELSKFVFFCDKFFDCLNTRSFVEHIQKRKPFLAPYRLVNDERFQFLDEFLEYLNEWQTAVENRPQFTRAERQKMFISRQTHEGIVTTVHGFKGAARYLLNHGVEYLFSNVFCQDPVEEHFGRHRGLGQRAQNPSVFQFGYQENQLRIQRNLAMQFTPRGNTAGRNRQRNDIEVDNQPLPKIRRH